MNNPQNEDDHSQGMPKDGLAQKRELLNQAEDVPRPLGDFDGNDAGEIKKSQSHYRNLLSLKKNKENLHSLNDTPVINPRILRGGELKR